MSPFFRTASFGAALALAACGSGGASGAGGQAPACVEDLDPSCAPLYAPAYDELFTRTLAPTCAVSGVACHSSEGAQGGLVFADATAAYAQLLGKDGARVRVIPGDPACSLLVERLESTDPTVQMPRGGQLSEAERCVFVQWIAAGAKR